MASTLTNPSSSSSSNSLNPTAKHQASPEESGAKRIHKGRNSGDEPDIDISHTLNISHPSSNTNPSFFIIEAFDGSSLAKLSPFAIEKAIQGSLGMVKQIK